MKIWIGADHAGFERKKAVIEHLRAGGLEVHDVGTFEAEKSVDYPDFANLVCKELKDKDPTQVLGILICGSGQGIAMRANKFPWIRAALCWSEESAQLSREHNDANVLCFGARLIEQKLSLQIVDRFLATHFAGGRHQGRVVKIGEKI